jgi:DNA-binding transcriptional LysR family regulator
VSLARGLQCPDALVFKDFLMTGNYAGILPDYLVRDESKKGNLLYLLPTLP